jgi:diadenosine tetraphosphate (Ap4A) HIT family hydrolase
MSAVADGCELCELAASGTPLYRDARLMVVLVDEPAYPGFCRVVLNAHVPEMTDLDPSERSEVMKAVMKVEAALREVMAPRKINLASLGNMTPHLHWHVIPRYADDAHFPSPIWAAAVRTTEPAVLAARRALLPQLCERIEQYLSTQQSGTP